MPRRKASTKITDPVKLKHNPRYSVVLMQQQIDLHSNEAQSLLHQFKNANIALFQLNTTLPRKATVVKAAELKRIVYDEIIQPLEEHLQAEYARINLLYQECRQQPVGSFSKPLATSVDLAHRDARRLLDLLVGFDQMHRKLADLWFAGQVDDGTYVKVTTNCRNVLKEAMKRIAYLVRDTVRMAKPKNRIKIPSTEISSETEG